jgi:cupin fold WbuC family metalloprotein
MKLITSDLLADLLNQASANPRRRAHHTLHESPADPIQRFFVAARRDSYFRPHRHREKEEFALVIQGQLDVLVLDDIGKVLQRVSLGSAANVIAFEMAADTWHAWLPMTDESLFFELKQGPYDPRTAAEFAPWSPAEGTPEVAPFMAKLRHAKLGDLLAQA